MSSISPSVEPVEPPDQLASDGLNELLRIGGRAVGQPGCNEKVAQVRGVKRRIAVLGLPEQAGQEAHAIFIARADVPAVIGVRIDEKGGGGRGLIEEEVDLVKARLRITTGDVCQQLRKRDVADPTTGRPSPAVFLVTKVVKGESRRALEATEVPIALRPDHKARRDLVVATDLHGTEPAATAAGRCWAGRNVARIG